MSWHEFGKSDRDTVGLRLSAAFLESREATEEDRVGNRSAYLIRKHRSRMDLDLVAAMAKVNMALNHGQTLEKAHTNFERAISEAQHRFGKYIRQVDWSPNRDSVQMVGPGFDVVLSYDEHKVHVRGTVPFAFKLMEVPIRAFITDALKHE